MHPDEHLRTQTAKTTENCVKGCVDSSQIVALKEDLNFLHRRKISNFSNFYYSNLEIPFKYLGNSKEIPRFSYKRLRENVLETYFIRLLLLKGNFTVQAKVSFEVMYIAYKLPPIVLSLTYFSIFLLA